MKVVLDTNVFVSGVFFGGPPFLILQAWMNGKIKLVISPEILDEYRRVGEILSEEYPAIDLKPILEFVIQNADVFIAPLLSEPVCEDPDDDKFIACALVSASRVIISGDKHLLNVTGFQDIEMLKPRDFLDKYL